MSRDIDKIYSAALQHMDRTVFSLTGRTPRPKLIKFRDGFAYRYAEKNLHQALVQKLARQVSSLRAAHLLMTHGFVQEQAALQRMLDELGEDISFLAYAAIRQEMTQQHENYLKYFYQEEFDPTAKTVQSIERASVPRKQIRAYLGRAGSPEDPTGKGANAQRTVARTYSGYVHAASPQIMDMYGGMPPHWHLRGMKDTGIYEGHRQDLWNYFYRAIMAFALASKAFGDDPLFESIRDFADEFATTEDMA